MQYDHSRYVREWLFLAMLLLIGIWLSRPDANDHGSPNSSRWSSFNFNGFLYPCDICFDLRMGSVWNSTCTFVDVRDGADFMISIVRYGVEEGFLDIESRDSD